jgi:hypothetical protein
MRPEHPTARGRRKTPRRQRAAAWAARTLALVREAGWMALLHENPGGEALDPLLGAPMEVDASCACLELANLEC